MNADPVLRRLAREARRTLALCLLLAARAAAQETADAPRTPRTVGRELKQVPNEIGWVLRAPTRANGSEWGTAAGVLALGGVVSVWDDDVDRWLVRHDTTALLLRLIRPLREGERFALGELPTGTRVPMLGAALYVAGLAARDRDLRDAGTGCVSAWTASALARYALYYTSQRLRPDSADGDQYRFALGGGGWQRQSFFGGHVANAFACSAFWSERFDLGVGEPALFLYSAGVGLARMADRRHWTSDTVVGAMFGMAVGRAVAARQLRRLAPDDAPPVPLVVVRVIF